MRRALLKTRHAAATVALLCAVAALSSCASLRRGGPAPSEPDTIIEVENRGFPDVVIYAVTAGDPFRLGMVTGSSTAKFKLPARFIGAGTLQILARPIAGRAYMLPTVLVSPGDHVEVTLASSPAQSTVSVAPR